MKCTPSILPAFPDSSLTHSPFLSQLGHIFLLKAFSFFKHPSSRPLLYDFTVLSHFLCYDVYLWKQPFPDSTSISPPVWKFLGTYLFHCCMLSTWHPHAPCIFVGWWEVCWKSKWLDTQTGPMQQERQNLSSLEKSGIQTVVSTHRDQEGKSDRVSSTQTRRHLPTLSTQ